MSKKKPHHKGTNKYSTVFTRMFLSIFVFSVCFVWGAYTFKNMVNNQESIVVSKDIYLVPFPVGVIPSEEKILENANVESFYKTFVYDKGPTLSVRTQWIQKAFDKIALAPWFQNLASVSSRTLVIYAGQRKEEIASNFSKILKWSDGERNAFLTIIEEDTPSLPEGKFYPGRYVTTKDANPEDIAHLVYEKFNEEILVRYPESLRQIVPLDTALTIASLLEREAYDFNDMRYISGIIWNRLFADMRLQIDATLQYVRANSGGSKWWPVPRPIDKKIDSPFNTYLYEGLPPLPIANPSVEAVLAALNPRQTDCLYYFHDTNKTFHCSKTYDEHKALVETYY